MMMIMLMTSMILKAYTILTMTMRLTMMILTASMILMTKMMLTTSMTTTMIAALYKANIQWLCMNLHHKNVMMVLFEVYNDIDGNQDMEHCNDIDNNIAIKDNNDFQYKDDIDDG